jgi:hypothetical protein
MSANVSILGNLGRAPETRFTPDGTFVANFSIAVKLGSQFAQPAKSRKPLGFALQLSEIKRERWRNMRKKGTRMLVQRQTDNRRGGSIVKAFPKLVPTCFCKIFSLQAETKKQKQTAAHLPKETIEHSVETEIASDVQEIPQSGISY